MIFSAEAAEEINAQSGAEGTNFPKFGKFRLPVLVTLHLEQQLPSDVQASLKTFSGNFVV